MLLSQLTAMIEHYQSYHGAANLYSQQLTINQVFKASETSCYPVTLHAYLDSEQATEGYISFHKQLQAWERELQTNHLIKANSKAYNPYFKVTKE